MVPYCSVPTGLCWTFRVSEALTLGSRVNSEAAAWCECIFKRDGGWRVSTSSKLDGKAENSRFCKKFSRKRTCGCEPRLWLRILHTTRRSALASAPRQHKIVARGQWMCVYNDYVIICNIFSISSSLTHTWMISYFTSIKSIQKSLKPKY